MLESSTDGANLAARLERLEAEQRSLRMAVSRWKRLAGVALGGVLVAGLAGAAADSLPTHDVGELNLRDSHGNRRATLTIRPDGTPGFALLDEAGEIRLSLDLSTKGDPGVHVYDAQGQLRGAFAVRPEGTPGVGLFDEAGQPRVSLDQGADGSGGVNVYDSQGALRAAIAVRADQTPGLGLFDKSGQPRVSTELGQDGSVKQSR